MPVRRIFLYAAILQLAAVAGANVYTSVVDAQNWGSAIPSSLDAAKQYFSVANPGTFFRAFSPAAQMAAFLCVIVCWKYGSLIRLLTVAALILSVTGDVMTLSYFYPRNEIMFGPGVHSNNELRDAWSGWATMNHVRSVLILASALSEMAALSVFERVSTE